MVEWDVPRHGAIGAHATDGDRQCLELCQMSRQRLHLVEERFRIGRAHEQTQSSAKIVGGEPDTQRREILGDAGQTHMIGKKFVLGNIEDETGPVLVLRSLRKEGGKTGPWSRS